MSAVTHRPRKRALVTTAHGGVLGIGDLGSAHQIPAGAVKVTVTRVSRNGMEFSTPLEGVGEVPIVLTDASGEVRFKLDEEDDGENMDFGDDWFADLKDARVRQTSGRGGRHDREELEYKLKVKRIVGVSGAHIHLGLPNMNGPVVADLYGPKVYSDPVEGDLSRGVLTVADLDGGPFEGDWAGFLEAMGLGELYVNVHTAEFPSGEIRGQIGVRKAKEHDEFNRPPTGEITSPEDDVSIAPGESVFFEGTAEDPDGDPVTVLWDFGDGGSSTDLAPGDHTYDNPGTYNVTFTATDDQGLSDPTPDTRTITVEAVPPAVMLTTLQATIFTPTCVRCHGGSEPEAGLDLSDGQSHGNLVNVSATTQPGIRVIPFDPDDSVLVTFLNDGHRNRPASERLQIRSWIGAGAQDN